MVDVRPAVESDIPELVRLRALFFAELGGTFFNPADRGADWQDSLADVLGVQLGSDAMRVLVVDAGDGLAACGYGSIQLSLPSPQLHNGRIGRVLGVVTDRAHRRRGHSRAIMEGLLVWFREREVGRVDLHASVDGEPLYRSLGFETHPDPSLSWLA